MVKKYAIEELEDLNEEKLFDAVEGIVEGNDEFTEEEKQIIYMRMEKAFYNMAQKNERLEDINEVLKTAKNFNHTMFPEQVNALKEAFEACDDEDWVRCRSVLEVFFEYEKPENIRQLDPSNWDYRHIVRWFEMFTQTKLCDEPEDTPVWIFSDMINDQVILKIPKELNLN